MHIHDEYPMSAFLYENTVIINCMKCIAGMDWLSFTLNTLFILILAYVIPTSQHQRSSNYGSGAPSGGHGHGHHHDPNDKPTCFHDPKVTQDAE